MGTLGPLFPWQLQPQQASLSSALQALLQGFLSQQSSMAAGPQDGIISGFVFFRRDSVDSRSSTTSSPKRPSLERSNSSRSKVETPKTPSSPSTPTFAPAVCLLASCYLTGDSVRDKCVEMLSAALKAEGEGLGWG